MSILCTPSLRLANKNKRALFASGTTISFRIFMAACIISVVSALVYASVCLKTPPGLAVSTTSKIKSLLDSAILESMVLKSTFGCTVVSAFITLMPSVALWFPGGSKIQDQSKLAAPKYVPGDLALACRAARACVPRC